MSSILRLAAGALYGASVDPISADWANISISSPASSGQNTAKTITFTNSSPRTISLDWDTAPATNIKYVKNGAAEVTMTDGITFQVVSGDTLYFTYYSTTEETITVTVADTTRGSTIDTFTCSYSATYGGDPPGCVVIGSFMAAGGMAEEVSVGDLIEALDYPEPGLRMARVEAVSLAYAPCVRIETESGATLELSEPTPITQRDGSMTIKACNSLGAEAAVKDANGLRWERIVKVESVGEKQIVRITAGQCTYGAGATPDAFIYTHNIKNNNEF